MQKKTNIKKPMPNAKKRAIAGWIFIMPWLCGILLFFMQPLVSLIKYSITDFKIGEATAGVLKDGIWHHYIYAFQSDTLFPQRFVNTILDMLYRVPVILIFSMFVSIVLNQKFRGRGFARMIFFLPVLITSGVIATIIRTSLTRVVIGGDSSTNIFNASLLTNQLLEYGLPVGFVNTLGGMVTNVSDLVWSSSVQILIFLMGLLTIPRSYYEVAQVEGATGWESFWKVTFPVVSPYILVNLIYTIIDHFVSYDNTVMLYITENAYKNFFYSYASALSWIYFIAIIICLAVLIFITSRFIQFGGSNAENGKKGR